VWVYRRFFSCKRYLCCKKSRSFVTSKVPASAIPWMWIGSGEESYTEIVNQNIVYGALLDKGFLNRITGLCEAEWRYVDAKTLEYLDFPSSGFIIEPNESASSISNFK